MATAIKHFSGTVGSTGGTSINWTHEDSDLELCLGNSIDKKKDFSSLIATDNPDVVAFNPDGSKIYITTDGTTNGITSFDLSTNWDIESTLSNQTVFDYMTATSVGSNNGPFTVWNNDGTQFLIVNDNKARLSFFTCSSAYNLSTASYTGDLEEFENSQTAMYGGAWQDSGNTFIVVNGSGEFQTYRATTPYDYSTLEWLAEMRFNSWSSYLSLPSTVIGFNAGIFGNSINDILISANTTAAYASSVTRFKPVVSSYPTTVSLVDSQMGHLGSVGSSSSVFFSQDGNYQYHIAKGGNYTGSYPSNRWIFRKPTSHTVAADQTIYTVPSGKVAKVTMNISGQSANVYAGNDKIAQLKGGSAIRHTQQGHQGFNARNYVSNESNPSEAYSRSQPSTEFYARGGRPLTLSIFQNEGPDFFMLTAGESLVLKNSVNVNFDIQVIEDNASS